MHIFTKHLYITRTTTIIIIIIVIIVMQNPVDMVL